MNVETEYCHFVRHPLSQFAWEIQEKNQKTMPQTVLFDDICAVLISSYVFPVSGGIIYFPTVGWERTVHLL